jgi:uncharacterized protein YkwD/uncharacterized membrane protein required for colicin V production
MITVVDIVIMVAFGYFIWSGYEQGLLLGVLNLVRTISAFFLSLVYYPAVGAFLTNQFGLGQTVGQIIGFVLILLVVEIVLGFFLHSLHRPVHAFMKKFYSLHLADKLLGILPSFAIGLILISTFTLLPLVLPMTAALRDQVRNSWWGRNVIPQVIAYEPYLESLIQRLPTRNLIYIVTRTPETDESIPIDIPTGKISVNPRDEEAMLTLLNKERVSRGLNALVMDDTIVEVARKHSEDMFRRGYFSHHNPDGQDPFDRMEAGGVTYALAGENLAYAPTVEIAHQGLMNSPGHRANILKEGYNKVGIGVMDAGLHGKMFTQNFTD